MKGKTIAMLIGIVAVIAAVAAVLYHFRDKLVCLCDEAKKECKCGKYAAIQDEQDVPEETEDAVTEEFKDYADVELPAEEV